jgi:tellurite resistance protein TehA-like permease
MNQKNSSHAVPANVMNGREILRFFSPRWFIAIMGTGAVANLLQLMSGQATGVLHALAVILLTISVMAFPVAFVLLSSRLFVDRQMLQRELEHSSLVQFYSAIFISASVCVTGLVKIPVAFVSAETLLGLAKLLWFLSLGIGSVLIVLTPWRIITLNHGEIRRILGFWFLPPVGLFVLVFAGNFLALKTGDVTWINTVAVLNLVLMGIAMFLSLMLFTMFLLRALALPFPPSMDVVPSFTIGLAPVGVSIIAMLSYLPMIEQAESITFVSLAAMAPLVKVLAASLWGFGFWWMFVALSITLTAVLRKGVPFTLGYWAFIFPPAAYALASLTLAQVTGLSIMRYTGFTLAWVLLLGWLFASLLTLRGIYSRRIFNLPASFDLNK